MKRLLLVTALVLVAATGYGQTPDGETPANEGVCDDLMWATPGLYGLCVAFCEAQDCEATFDPATGEVTFAHGCKPSNPRLLERFNQIAGPFGPPMPCRAGSCPCWTEDDLTGIADGLSVCNFLGDGIVLGGRDLLTNEIEQAFAFTHPFQGPLCRYEEHSPRILRLFLLTAAEFAVCTTSLAAECASRGHPPV